MQNSDFLTPRSKYFQLDSRDHEFQPNQCSQQTPKIQDIKLESDNNINLRLNSWNKYRSIKSIYDGLASATDNENDLQKTTDLQHEYGLTLLDADSSDSDQEDEPTLVFPRLIYIDQSGDA